MDRNGTLSFNYEYQAYSTQELIDIAAELPIHQFDSEIPPGKVLDVGYRMGGMVLYYASKGRPVHALDMEPYHEKKLRKRLSKTSYGDLIEFSISTMPGGKLPDGPFAVIILGSMLHFLDFGGAQLLVERLTKLLMPGGWVFTQNHHETHLYGKNPDNLGTTGYYKHFFNEQQIRRLFHERTFIERYMDIRDKARNEKERLVSEHYFSLYPKISREYLRQNYIDVDYHTDIITVHQKRIIA